MFSMRDRTLSPSSSRFTRSFGVSGSRCPKAHWPWPLCALLRGVVVVLLVVVGAMPVLRGCGGARPYAGGPSGDGGCGATTRRQSGTARSAAHTDRARHVAVVHVEPRDETRIGP